MSDSVIRPAGYVLAYAGWFQSNSYPIMPAVSVAAPVPVLRQNLRV